MSSWLSELVFGVDIDKLQAELVQSRAELVKLKNENDRLNSTVNARQNAIGRLTDRIKRKDETIANLRSAAQLHKQELKDKSSEVSALNRTTTKLRADFEKINNSIDRLNDKINRKDETIEELKTSNQQLKQELRSKTTEINRLNKSAEKHQDMVAELNETISLQADCINDKDKAIADLKSTVQQQELGIQNKAAEIINLNDTVASLNDEIAKQNGAVTQWINNDNRKSKAIFELKSEIQQKELAIHGKLEEIANLNDVVANFHNEIAGLNDRIEVLKSSVKDKDDENSSLNVELGRCKSQVDEKEEEIQHLHEKIQSLKEDNKQLEFNLEEEKQECDKCSFENRVLKLDNNALKSENDRLKEQLAEIKRNLSQPETESQSGTETNQSSGAESQSKAEAESQSSSESDEPSDAESQSEAAVVPLSDAGTQSGTESAASPGADVQCDNVSEQPSEVGAPFGTEAEQSSDAESQPEAAAETSSEAGAQSGAEDGQLPEAGSQRDAAVEQSSAATAEPSSETVSKPEVEQTPAAESQTESEDMSQPDAEAESEPLSDEEQQSDTGAKTQPSRSPRRTTRTRSPLASNGTDVSRGDIPTIGNGKQKSRRSIRKVINTETGEEIEADKFFQQDNDTIQMKAHFLEEAKTTELPKFVCSECNQPVKIAKRGNNYYFQHWTRNPDCVYTPLSSQSPTAESGILMPEESAEDRDEMLDKICRQIENRSDVESAKKKELIPSVFPYMFYRRADIFVEFRNGNRLVIQFTNGKTSLKSLVDKDIFFWLHGIYVIWVYSNEADDYSGIRSIANQNAIFYCHRNIFFYDKECREKSDERNEFIFKCNYLNENNNWHYKIDTSDNNGELITLGDLTFPHDDVELKPYYFEANKPYFDLHPDKEGEYISSHRNRGEYLDQLQKDWTDTPVRREAINRCVASNSNTTAFCSSQKWGLRFQGIKIVSNIFDEEPKLVNGVYVVCCNGQYGLVSGCSDKVLFDWTGISEISPLRDNLFKFKKDRRYGIVGTDGEVKVLPEYISITCVRNGLYKLDTGVYTKFVDEEFNEVEEESIPLKDGFVKIKRRGLWGVKNGADEIVVDCKYSEISSFRSRFIGFINNKAIRLTASGNYNYRLPMCIGNSFRREGTKYVVNIGGQKCVLQAGEHLPRISDGKINVAIENMLNDNILVTLNNTSKPLSKPIDKPDDFEMNETYSGKVCRVLRNGKSTNYILKMDDGKEIFVNGKVIAKGGEKLAVDTEVKITKTGYNYQLDKTLWKRVEPS